MVSTKLRINEPDVVSETIDGETVAVSLSTGTYYSLGGSAPDVWNLIESGFGVDQMLDSLVQKFEGDHNKIAEDLDMLIKQLQAEKLIVTDEASAPKANSTSPTGADSSDAAPLTYEPPVLQKFNDMQELLLLDPIHEVDTSVGWPAAKVDEA